MATTLPVGTEFKFLAFLPDISGAIRTHGARAGMRFTLEVDDSEKDNAEPIGKCQECMLEITVKVVEGAGY